MSGPRGLRVEHLDDHVLGLGVATPRLSWQLPPGTRLQAAYQLEIDGQQQRRVDVPNHLYVPWPTTPVGSATRVPWRVRIWSEEGESPWSEGAWFETGLLEPADWCATWIAPDETELLPAGARPPWIFRSEFVIDDDWERARCYATAHGIYEMFLNGKRVGDFELTPGFTGYQNHLNVQVFDVGDLLRPGSNEWRAVVSDGWYRGKVGTHQRSESYGTGVAFLGQLHVNDVVVATSARWTAANGPIRAADLMDGQIEDHAIAATGGQPVLTADHGFDRLGYSPAPPVRATDRLMPLSIRQLDDDRQVVDFGQNINGRVRLRELGPLGTSTVLVHGEALDDRGDVTLAPLATNDHELRQTDIVTSAGLPGDEFEPHHTVHGFRYVRVSGHPGVLARNEIEAVELRTDLRRTGWFRCSDSRLNRLHEIADWSFRGNSCDIPTDCPTRERQGWTGDWQVFLPSAAFLYDVAGFSMKWLNDLAAEQLDSGCVLNFAPDPMRARNPSAEEEPIWHYLQGSSGWGDAVVIVPWEIYRQYGDRAVLSDLWPNMLRWLDFAAESARTKRFAGRAAVRPTPAPHEEYLWDGGFHWGEWLEPDAGYEDFWQLDQGHVGTAYLHHSAELAARIGRLLGHDDVAARLDELAGNTLDAWRTEYIGPDGSLTPDTQAAHVRALAFGLVPEALREQTAVRLAQLVRDAGNHLGTGFLSTPLLLPVLADAGYCDLAYDVLLQSSPPSWLTMVDRGATTVWEEWEGIDADGRAHASLNHYSKGAVVSFLHRYVAGIRLCDDESAYRRFLVQPVVGGGLTWAEATHDSPFGRIKTAWRIDEDRFLLTVTVPSGSTAEIVLPDGVRAEQTPGTSHYGCSAPSG